MREKVCILCLALLCAPLGAGSWTEALRLRDQGKLEDAVELLARAWARDEDPRVGYNLALCLLETGMADSAARVLERVLQGGRVPDRLRRDALYNLGLAKASQAMNLQARPAKARALYTQAIGHFRDAIRGEADQALVADAGYNIEAIWRMLKNLEQVAPQEGPEQMAQRLSDLINRQEQLSDQTRAGEGQASRQEDLANEAQDLASQLDDQGHREEAQRVQEAGRHQREAARDLREGNQDQALEHQHDALDRLREALASLVGREEARPDSVSALEAARELARLEHEAQRERQRRREALQRDPRARAPVSGPVRVEKNW